MIGSAFLHLNNDGGTFPRIFRCIFIITALQFIVAPIFMPTSATIGAKVMGTEKIATTGPVKSWQMRRNLLVLVIGAFLDVGVIYAAAAADVPIRTPVYAPPVTLPLYNWSGLYLGANVGGAWSNRTLNVAGTAWDDPFSSAF